jgi:activator of HSP90 ATPase
MPRTIHQTMTFKATPHQVYEALMDSAQHAQFSGATAHISRQVGGEFSTYDGYIQGRNVELVPDARIVQRWRASDWPEGVDSEITFELTALPSGTRLRFTHRGVPDEQHDAIKQGWIDYYWKPMKALFASSQ